MNKQKICIAAKPDFGLTVPEQVKLFAETGFDGFFTGFRTGTDLAPVRKAADENGMFFQSVHAPFGGCADMWGDDGDEIKKFTSELIDCVHACAENGVPLMVSHAYIGFDGHDVPSERGIENYAVIVREAEKYGIEIAFENTEGEEFLSALMNAFRDCPNVGFCWDSGHEMCYNHSKDMLALYGDRLFGTHLNDNLGVSRYDGRIFWTDDLHLLPFDGIGDWDGIAARLDGCGFERPLTFELNITSKPGRHDNDKYNEMKLAGYLAEAYARACRVAAKRSKNR